MWRLFLQGLKPMEMAGIVSEPFAAQDKLKVRPPKAAGPFTSFRVNRFRGEAAERARCIVPLQRIGGKSGQPHSAPE
jgi:hypothetical protein